MTPDTEDEAASSSVALNLAELKPLWPKGGRDGAALTAGCPWPPPR